MLILLFQVVLHTRLGPWEHKNISPVAKRLHHRSGSELLKRHVERLLPALRAEKTLNGRQLRRVGNRSTDSTAGGLRKRRESLDKSYTMPLNGSQPAPAPALEDVVRREAALRGAGGGRANGEQATIFFQCLDGKGGDLAMESLNDNYCDCADGSDEPLTSACSGYSLSRVQVRSFVCHRSGGGVPTVRLFASRVGDGVCDCCDGSDEFSDKGLRGPSASSAAANANANANAKEASGARGGAASLPCPDTCSALRASAAGARALFERGAVIRRDRYAHAASRPASGRLLRLPTRDQQQLAASLFKAGPAEQQDVGGGSENAFFALVGRCFEHRSSPASPFVYELCPFGDVKQLEVGAKAESGGGTPHGSRNGGNRKEQHRRHSGKERLIGKEWRWVEIDRKMIVTGGDGGCVGGGNRRAEVTFECAEEDSLTRVEEPATCAYEFSLRTPAACTSFEYPV